MKRKEKGNQNGSGKKHHKYVGFRDVISIKSLVFFRTLTSLTSLTLMQVKEHTRFEVASSTWAVFGAHLQVVVVVLAVWDIFNNTKGSVFTS